MVTPPRRPAARVPGIRALAWLGVCILVAACTEMPAAPPAPPSSFLASRAGRPPLAIGVLVAGWHSGLVLPADELGPLSALLPASRQAQYLSFGWGNRRFYMSAQPGPGDALAALFRSPSVLLVQPASAPAELLGADVQIHWVCVDRDELWRVVSYIKATLSRPGGNPVDLGGGPFPESRFYASSGRYSAVHTCNTWTVAALQYARLPVRAGGAIFAGQTGRRIRALRACSAMSSRSAARVARR